MICEMNSSDNVWYNSGDRKLLANDKYCLAECLLFFHCGNCSLVGRLEVSVDVSSASLAPSASQPFDSVGWDTSTCC